MASRAERRRAAAVLFLFAVLPRSLALDLAAVDARAVLKWQRQSPARRRACEPCANVGSVGSGQTHPHSFRTMTFVDELAVVATETTVPRGRVSSAGKLACSCAVSLPCFPNFCALATAELGAREVVKKAITKTLARTQTTAAKKKKPVRSAGALQRQLSGRASALSSRFRRQSLCAGMRFILGARTCAWSFSRSQIFYESCSTQSAPLG